MPQYRLLMKSQQQSSYNKYSNQKTTYNGIVYDSKRESKRAGELDILKRIGEVKSWLPQSEFRIEHRGVKICSYFADFKVVYADGHVEFEDVKGVKTAVYKLKKKLVKAFHGVDIKEI